MKISFEIQQVSKCTVAVIDESLASNAGAILLDEYIIAVDATMRPDTSRIFRKMLEDKYHRPVRYLCVTHYHADHVFGLKHFKDATIFASSQIAENLKLSPDWSPQAFAARKNDDPTAREWLDDVEFIIPSMLFQRRIDIIDRDKTIEFHHAGGHTSCSVFAYFAGENILFAGDLIFAGQFPYAGDATCDPEQWIATLKSWLDLDISQVIPGHGPLTGVDEIKKHLELF